MSRFLSSIFSRILPSVVLIHVLAFTVFWLTNNLFYASTNDYMADLLGRRLNYVNLLIGISILTGTWSCIRLVLNRLGRTHKWSLLSSWLYGLVSLLYLLFFYGSFGLLFRESPVQLVRIGQLFAYYRVVLDGVLLMGITLLAIFLLKNMLGKSKTASVQRNWRPLTMALLVFVILWSLPLFFPPESVVHDQLPDKPLIIAHRGASMLAPENTMAAAQLASELGVYGLETDIQINRDEELFLLHDDVFNRTTDIKSVFPGREKEPAENFTHAEISKLNAGKWFVEQDPFQAISQGLVSPDQIKEYQQQAVPVLADWLDLVRKNHLKFIFDLKQSPQDPLSANTLFDTSLNQIHQAGIDSQIWFLADEGQLSRLHNLAPEMLPAFGLDYQSPPAADELKSQGYQIVNVEYGIDREWIRRYQDAGLWVNVYTVDEPWQFSRLWLAGVNSVTTSNAQVMLAMNWPILSLPYNLYVLIWGIVGLSCVGLIIGMILPSTRIQFLTKPNNSV